MRLDEIEGLILELLAEDARCSVTEFRDRLRSGGPALPVDSLLAAEIVAEVQDRVGVELPATAETARALRSVRTFAVAVHELLSLDRASRELSA
jgi:acyl carrier protein